MSQSTIINISKKNNNKKKQNQKKPVLPCGYISLQFGRLRCLPEKDF
jgi:hypothetical protein